MQPDNKQSGSEGRHDLLEISSGAPVDMVYAFLAADLPIAAQHDLIDLAAIVTSRLTLRSLSVSEA
jgi:hypothetical protein